MRLPDAHSTEPHRPTRDGPDGVSGCDVTTEHAPDVVSQPGPVLCVPVGSAVRADAADNHDRPTMLVRSESAYECGRQTLREYLVTAPSPGLDADELHDWLFRWVPTGDGHSCGARERGLYELTVLDAPPDRPDLAGFSAAADG